MESALTQFDLSVQFIEDTLSGMLLPNVSLSDGVLKLRGYLTKVATEDEEAAGRLVDPLAHLLEEVYFAFGTDEKISDLNPVKMIDSLIRLGERMSIEKAPELFDLVLPLVKNAPDLSYHIFAGGLLDSMRKEMRHQGMEDIEIHTQAAMEILVEANNASARGGVSLDAIDSSAKKVVERIRDENIEIESEALARFEREKGSETTIALLENKYGLIIGLGYETKESSSHRIRLFTLRKELVHPDKAEEKRRSYATKGKPLRGEHEEEHSMNIRSTQKSKVRPLMNLLQALCHKALVNIENVKKTLESRTYKGGEKIDVKSAISYDSLKMMTARSLRDIEHFYG